MAFGQGTLFDIRRKPEKMIHKMEGDPPVILIGYYRWHVFLPAASLIYPNWNQNFRIGQEHRFKMGNSSANGTPP